MALLDKIKKLFGKKTPKRNNAFLGVLLENILSVLICSGNKKARLSSLLLFHKYARK